VTAGFAQTIFQAAGEAGLAFAPVYLVGRTDTATIVAEFARHQSLGLAVRFRVADLIARGSRQLADLLAVEITALDQIPGSMDLVVDLGYMSPDAELSASDLAPLLERLQNTTPWRSIVVAATSVPPSVAPFVNEGSLNGIRRQEWALWNGLRRLGFASLRFGDYGIQNSIPPDPMNAPRMVASIRYTAGDWMFVARGEGSVRHMSAPEQVAEYRELARRMFLHPPFIGRDCCAGDRFIEDCADGLNEVRTQRVWRGWGTLHHIVVVSIDVSEALPTTVRRAEVGTRRIPAGSRRESVVPTPAAPGNAPLRIPRTGPRGSRDRRR
jgi:hypothetical protein